MCVSPTSHRRNRISTLLLTAPTIKCAISHHHRLTLPLSNSLDPMSFLQVAVISGESGAGKTESTKHFIRQIMNVCSRGASDADERHPIEIKILAVCALLVGT